MRSTVSRGSVPSSPLASAAAFFSTPSARIIGREKCSVPMLKWCSDRSVWAPQYRSVADLNRAHAVGFGAGLGHDRCSIYQESFEPGCG